MDSKCSLKKDKNVGIASKKTYFKPDVDVIVFSYEDIIRTSICITNEPIEWINQ